MLSPPLLDGLAHLHTTDDMLGISKSLSHCPVALGKRPHKVQRAIYPEMHIRHQAEEVSRWNRAKPRISQLGECRKHQLVIHRRADLGPVGGISQIRNPHDA